MKLAYTCLCCKVGECEGLRFVRVEQTADTLHEFNLRIHDACASRLAAQARTKAGLFRRFG